VPFLEFGHPWFHCWEKSSLNILQNFFVKISLLIHLHAIPNMYDFISSVNHKRRYFEEYENSEETINILKKRGNNLSTM